MFRIQSEIQITDAIQLNPELSYGENNTLLINKINAAGSLIEKIQLVKADSRANAINGPRIVVSELPNEEYGLSSQFFDNESLWYVVSYNRLA